MTKSEFRRKNPCSAGQNRFSSSFFQNANLSQKTMSMPTRNEFEFQLLLSSFFIPLSVYLRTLGQTVLGGDSGDIVVSAYKLSVAHPPGYPLMTMLGHFAIQTIPLGEAAWRVSVLNAVFAATASLFVALSVSAIAPKDHPLSIWITFASSLWFSFSKSIWIYSATPEVPLFAKRNNFTDPRRFLPWTTCLSAFSAFSLSNSAAQGDTVEIYVHA